MNVCVEFLRSGVRSPGPFTIQEETLKKIYCGPSSSVVMSIYLFVPERLWVIEKGGQGQGTVSSTERGDVRCRERRR